MMIALSFLVASLQPLAGTQSTCDLPSFDADQARSRRDIAAEMSSMMVKFEGFSERRVALLDRLDEVHRMSTVQRKLKSTFNPDYDIDVLNGRNENLQVQIDGLKQRFEFEKRRLDFLTFRRDLFINSCARAGR